MARIKATTFTKTCRRCGVGFLGSGPAALFCEMCASARREERRVALLVPRADRPCEMCGSTYLGRESDRWCGPRCKRQAAGNKRCVVCKETLPLANFGDNRRTYDGLNSTCKSCRAQQRAARYHADVEESRSRGRAYYRANRDKWVIYAERARARDPEGTRAKGRRKRHLDTVNKMGWEPDIYQRLAEAQGNRCATCGGVPKPGHYLAIDHDHETGAARGLLCRPCNLGIGNLGEDPARLRAAADYLERFLPRTAG